MNDAGDRAPEDFAAADRITEIQELRRLGRAGDALVLARQTLDALPTAEGDVRAETRVRVEMVQALCEDGDRAGALRECETIIGAARHHSAEDVRQLVAYALGEKAVLLLNAGRYQEAIEANGERLRYSRSLEEPEAALHAAKAHLVAADVLGRTGGWAEALQHCVEALNDLGPIDSARGRACIAQAPYHRARALRALEHTEQALDASGELLRRFRESEEPDVEHFVDLAYIQTAELLVATGAYEQAVELCDGCVEAWDGARSPQARARQLEALNVKVGALGGLDRAEEMVEPLAEVMRRSEDLGDEASAAKAFVAQSTLLQELGRDAETELVIAADLRRHAAAALRAYDETIACVRSLAGIEAHRELLANLQLKAWILRELGRTPEAISTLQEAVDAVDDGSDPRARHLGEAAREARDALLGGNDTV